ncbi:hypothetical protein Nepgr_021389 [Nepenthes gracilis]|uniref:Uncharacterized protein n=1 Tax=Nepenthes gracilis TaxID=150966 RepID=A0AAD3SWQ7_NEPGR|nr:hypothetical protein Nepgr_021389 [Nepenthes gracilis]
MDKKQLNFSVPLLSVRRYASLLHSPLEEKDSHPSLKSDSNLGDVVKPGSVPFCWEQIPGKAKGRSEFNHHEEPSNIPQLPPARLLGTGPWTSVNKSGEQKRFRPPHNYKFSGELIISSLRDISSCVARSERSMEGGGQNAISDSETNNADALDTFSQLESISINCSIGGSSGPEHPPGAEPRGPFTTDQVFLMNRFLCAAKAMTLESPQHASRKQLEVFERAREVKAVVPIVQGLPRMAQNVADISPHGESDDGDHSCALPSNVSVKACGFLPWFCSKKNSLRFLNPVPAMKVGTKSALSSASKIGRLVKAASARSPIRTSTKDKVDSGVKISELPGTGSKQKGRCKPMYYSGELSCTNSRRGAISRRKNESPHSFLHKGVGFLALSKGVNQPNRYEPELQGKGGPWISKEPSSPIVEKTLYIDSASIPQANASSLEIKWRVDGSQNGVGAVTESMTSPPRFRLDIMNAGGIGGPPLVSEAVGGRPPSSFEVGRPAEKTNVPAFDRMNMPTDGKINVSRELIVKENQCPLPPPLPKSPSDSWLSRNLTSVSPRNSFSHSNIRNKAQPGKQINAKAPASGTKWETIVKNSHLRYNYGRYSEELVTHVSQLSQTRK